MSTIFRLDASIRQDGSVTRAVADTLESTIAQELGSTDVVRRDIGTNPLDGSVWASAAFSGFTPEEARTDEQKAASALGAELADELVAADALIFAVPMYNFGVSQHFKTWYDLVATDARFAPGAQTIAGRPAFQRHCAWGRLRGRHAARGLGPRDRLDAPGPGGRVGTRPRRHRDRADARRGPAPDGGTA